ncbi:MAG: hypothetical protein CL578_06580 [Alteromonadaceae bacterium]|uniref:Uncharacterized protein n=1 Tax=Paraglaciecola agarilytica NO2 TaxID=1125747 RepID=A0ABQ0IAD8_9ALTE|nr:hypothetical protein [Alteromonadaceae bacterium]GAC06346.1 hypothetical protein GAGA_3513 [Paraglaciecola agarilytica NO2]
MKYSAFSTVIWFYCCSCFTAGVFFVLSRLGFKPICHIAVVFAFYNHALTALANIINVIM